MFLLMNGGVWGADVDYLHFAGLVNAAENCGLYSHQH